MIRVLLEDMLGELGYTVAAEVARIEEALEATNNAEREICTSGSVAGLPQRNKIIDSETDGLRKLTPRNVTAVNFR